MGELYSTSGKVQIFIQDTSPVVQILVGAPMRKLYYIRTKKSCDTQYEFQKQIFDFEKFQCSTFKLVQYIEKIARVGGDLATGQVSQPSFISVGEPD